MSRSAFGMGVDVRHPLFPHKVVCNALGFLLKCITRFSDVCQHKLIITLDIAGSIDRSTTIINLQQRPRKYSLHCFIAMNPDPKEKVSTEVCFLLNQWTKEQFYPDKETCLGSSGDNIRCMISIHLSLYSEAKAPRFRDLGRQHLLALQMANFTGDPILGFKHCFINHGITGVIHDLSIVVFFLDVQRYAAPAPGAPHKVGPNMKTS